MAELPVGVTDQASGAGVAQVRTRSRTVGAETVAEQYVIPISERVPSYKGVASTFRTTGVAAANNNIFAIHNATGSAVLVAIRRLVIQIDDTGVLTSVAPLVRTHRITTLPTGGTAVTKVPFDTAQSSAAAVTIFGATASDAGAATAITATAGATLWAQFKMRAPTQVGQFLFPDESLLPRLAEDDPVILRPLEGLLVQMTQASVTTAHYVVNCMWEEFTLP